MGIRLKVARTASELDDVFKLRYDVYVEERGKFSAEEGNKDKRIIDQFDAIPGVINIIAYNEEDNQAIACMRVNLDSDIGLPAEKYFSFLETREKLERDWKGSLRGEKHPRKKKPVLASVGMLAIRQKWRNRRNVIFALFKTVVGVMHSMGATHIIGVASTEIASLYERMGVFALHSPQWIESVGDKLIPMMAPFDGVLKWAYGDVSDDNTPFWLINYSFRFERLLLSAGEVLFFEGDKGKDAYAIDDGWIAISRKTHDQESGKSQEIVLANLPRPALLGELALFDDEPRAATATAITNVELIVIGRKQLYSILQDNPDKMKDIICHFTRRVRETDDMVIQAYAPHTIRVDFALNKLWLAAPLDRKNPEYRIAKVGPAQLALSARVPESDVIDILEKYQKDGILEYGKKRIHFFQMPAVDWTEE